MEKKTINDIRRVSGQHILSKPASNKMQSIFLSDEEERQFFRDARKFIGTQERLGHKGQQRETS